MTMRSLLLSAVVLTSTVVFASNKMDSEQMIQQKGNRMMKVLLPNYERTLNLFVKILNYRKFSKKSPGLLLLSGKIGAYFGMGLL